MEVQRDAQEKRQIQCTHCWKPVYLVSVKDLPVSFSSILNKKVISFWVVVIEFLPSFTKSRNTLAAIMGRSFVSFCSGEEAGMAPFD